MKLTRRRGWVQSRGFRHKIEGYEYAWGDTFVWAPCLLLLPFAFVMYGQAGSYPLGHDGFLGLCHWRASRVDKLLAIPKFYRLFRDGIRGWKEEEK